MVLTLVALLPFARFLDSYNYVLQVGITILMWIAMVSGWNILGGYTGYISLGHNVFFGIGGYAAGTVSGVLTRRYHGLLIAPLYPPLGRCLVFAKADAVLVDGDDHVPFAFRLGHETRPLDGGAATNGHEPPAPRSARADRGPRPCIAGPHGRRRHQARPGTAAYRAVRCQADHRSARQPGRHRPGRAEPAGVYHAVELQPAIDAAAQR